MSLEVFADEYFEIKNKQLRLQWGKNIYVKVPIVNSKGKFMGKVIRDLNKKNIKLNITAVHGKTD